MGKNQRGFTLTEVLIVVAIIGLLASLVMPRFFGQNERGIAAEAVAMLSAIRQAEVAYNLENSVYTTDLTNLDVDVTPSTKFTYAADVAGTATATRTGSSNPDVNGTTIILDVSGNWSGTHPFKPN